MSRQNIRQNPNQNYSNNNQNQNYNNQEQSSNQLQLSVQSRRALDLLKKSRANRSEFMIIGIETVRLQFDPAKSHVEKKTFNGQTTERIAHSVVNVDDITAGEKTLSLTYKKSQPVEEAMEDGYTIMEVTKVGEGFSLSYNIKPIE